MLFSNVHVQSTFSSAAAYGQPPSSLLAYEFFVLIFLPYKGEPSHCCTATFSCSTLPVQPLIGLTVILPQKNIRGTWTMPSWVSYKSNQCTRDV